jgi:hypothetical protein
MKSLITILFFLINLSGVAQVTVRQPLYAGRNIQDFMYMELKDGIWNFDTMALQSINNKFNCAPIKLRKWSSYYSNSNWQKNLGIRLSYQPISLVIQGDSIENYFYADNLIRRISPSDTLTAIGFHIGVNSDALDNINCRNFSKLLYSAYLQETDSVYLNTDSNFSELKQKSHDIYKKKRIYSLGAAVKYVSDDNQFYPQRSGRVFVGYLMDVLTYFGVARGIVALTQDVGLGLGVMLGSYSINLVGRIMSRPSTKFYFKLQEEINRSGYRIPNNLNYLNLF